MSQRFKTCQECHSPEACTERGVCSIEEGKMLLDAGAFGRVPLATPRDGIRRDPLGWPLTMVMGNFQGLRCEEASAISVQTYIPCSLPAVALIWHDKDRRAYLMCFACASHNVVNRGGRLVIDGSKGAILTTEVARLEKWKNWGNPYA